MHMVVDALSQAPVWKPNKTKDVLDCTVQVAQAITRDLGAQVD